MVVWLGQKQDPESRMWKDYLSQSAQLAGVSMPRLQLCLVPLLQSRPFWLSDDWTRAKVDVIGSSEERPHRCLDEKFLLFPHQRRRRPD